MCGHGHFGRGHFQGHFGHGHRGMGFRMGWTPGGEPERGPELSDKGYLAVILDLLKDEPKTGYALVEHLEERLNDLFDVGPARVYPALQLLEDLGYIAAETHEDKKRYAITEAGRAYLAEREEALQHFWARAAARKVRIEARDLAWELKSLARSFFPEAGDPQFDAERLRRLREFLANARRTIDDDLAS